ncbi:hypothetical protein Hanom_Chr13g01232591 [Helianthus anomalus]
MYVTYCKLYPLSSIITENVLDICKPLQVMSFSPNLVNFLSLNLTKWTPHKSIFVVKSNQIDPHMRVEWPKYPHVGSIWSYLTTKID